MAGASCPACGTKVKRDVNWCGTCGFTGAKTIEMFGESPPPLAPLLDVADLWSEEEVENIESAISRIGKRYPQIRWRVCAVALGDDVSLPLFGFWLMNVCPLAEGESPEDRKWTVLLLLDSATLRASVTTGYDAEIWLTDEMWDSALQETRLPLQQDKPGVAVTAFLDSAKQFLDISWKRSQKQISKDKRQ